LGAVVGLGFAYVGLQTDDMTLAINPCASPLDNPFARVAQIAFLSGIGASLAIIVLSAVTKNRDAVFFGIVAGVAGLAAMLVGMLLAGAGYGWHCPNS
jgi:hypothetical protein